MTTQLVDDSDVSIQSQVEKLELSISALLDLCKKLSSENEAFKNSNSRLMQERSELQLTNDKVRAQVEAMVDRLRALEKAS
ncbi:MAG TPA: cell division protein ZapB [Leucothrix sp.]|nr:cell division protein ZapB [Leucothrix sp.]